MKTRPFLTERLLIGRKELNQPKQKLTPRDSLKAEKMDSQGMQQHNACVCFDAH